MAPWVLSLPLPMMLRTNCTVWARTSMQMPNGSAFHDSPAMVFRQGHSIAGVVVLVHRWLGT
eukprot:4472141-Heterocapsa_arctica.AAC.1